MPSPYRVQDFQERNPLTTSEHWKSPSQASSTSSSKSKEREILTGIPKGNHQHVNANYFYQAVHAAVLDLAKIGHDGNATPSHHELSSRLKAHLTAVAITKQSVNYETLITLTGLIGWTTAVAQSDRDPEQAIKAFYAMSQLMPDMYATPPLTWMRTAYSRRMHDHPATREMDK